MDKLYRYTIELPLSLIRTVCGLPQPRITRQQVRDMVKQEIEQNYPEVASIGFFVIPRLKHYYVPINPLARDAHIAFIIDIITGELDKIDVGEFS